ncbi:hypothetical protein B0H67DRAFT_648799 [Lasiosphaeris hirsuta]|uniref:Uncharacterized protein n=1 Tax=Lasiosphaeris hirsuta TaxID=260670 RepID=A0AA39ZVJ4_9PEZI|nr:hypothetical protein B0H67DRAFT_648799 [Lasiosphaeris hirsuta]
MACYTPQNGNQIEPTQGQGPSQPPIGPAAPPSEAGDPAAAKTDSDDSAAEARGHGQVVAAVTAKMQSLTLRGESMQKKRPLLVDHDAGQLDDPSLREAKKVNRLEGEEARRRIKASLRRFEEAMSAVPTGSLYGRENCGCPGCKRNRWEFRQEEERDE